MWRVTSGSETGTSHLIDNLPCQDACRVAQIDCPDGPVLVCVCADGAGSVTYADVGAQLACADLIELCTAMLPAELPFDQFHEFHAREWCAFLRESLQLQANQLLASMDDLACTLVVALIGTRRSCFFQIGDGGVVVRTQERLQLIFPPDHGEFAETTYFLTDQDVGLHLRFTELDTSVDGLVAFTDGLESLLLSYPDFSVHNSFFEKVLAAAETTDDSTDLTNQLRQLLNSTTVNERTSDDKTLIIAARIPQSGKEGVHASAIL